MSLSLVKDKTPSKMPLKKFLNFFVTMFFQSKEKGFITAHMSPTLGAKTHIYCDARPSTGSLSRSVLITQAQSPKTIQALALKLGKMIEAGGWVKKTKEKSLAQCFSSHVFYLKKSLLKKVKLRCHTCSLRKKKKNTPYSPKIPP